MCFERPFSGFGVKRPAPPLVLELSRVLRRSERSTVTRLLLIHRFAFGGLFLTQGALLLAPTLPGDLEEHVARFVEHYNHQRYHGSLKNLPPADVPGAARPSYCNANGSNAKPLNNDDCNTQRKPPKLNKQPSQSIHSSTHQAVPKHSTTDTRLVNIPQLKS